MIERKVNGQFEKGVSGNRKGKVKGTRNKATLAALSLIEGESEALSRKAVEMALSGDMAALRLCIERVAPPAKERPLPAFELPPLNSLPDVLNAIDVVAQRLVSGELLPSEATAVCSVLEQYRRQFETTEMQERINSLEATLKLRNKK